MAELKIYLYYDDEKCEYIAKAPELGISYATADTYNLLGIFALYINQEKWRKLKNGDSEPETEKTAG